MVILGKVDPQPPRSIRYMLGGETWLPEDKRTPLRMHVEEWGNLGPMELDPSIGPNSAGFRVRSRDILAPPGAHGFTTVNGVVYWTDTDMFGRTPEERSLPHPTGPRT